jgi:glycosyltransferase involved in cell wall biosynthesis
VLIVCDYYLPGHKGGGTIRSLANLVARLGEEFDFRVVTRDRDLGDDRRYPSVRVGEWTSVGKAQVMYLPSTASSTALRAAMCKTEHDLLYLNSFFSRQMTVQVLLMRRLGLVPKRPLVLAPRGEFSAGALTLHRGRKRLYLLFARLGGLLRDVVWQASTEHEAADLRRVLGGALIRPRGGAGAPGDAEQPVRLFHATDLAAPPAEIGVRGTPSKLRGYLRVAFVGRVSPMKNLKGALEMLQGVEGELDLRIFGPIEDHAYWSRCREVIRALPANVSVTYQGEMEHARVGPTLESHDLLFLPTLGENYGHVILESLLAGCPVLISDRTPWRRLREAGVGWDLSLDEPEAFRAALQSCVEMDAEEHSELSHSARRFAVQQVRACRSAEDHRYLFEAAVGYSLRPSTDPHPLAVGYGG